jgi:hypothetical protein
MTFLEIWDLGAGTARRDCTAEQGERAMTRPQVSGPGAAGAHRWK